MDTIERGPRAGRGAGLVAAGLLGGVVLARFATSYAQSHVGHLLVGHLRPATRGRPPDPPERPRQAPVARLLKAGCR